MAAIPPEIDQQIKLMNSLQKQMKSLQEQSEKLRTQQTENDQVLKELDLLDSSAAVFKLIGGLMVKQSAEEAKGNVQKRLDFIQSELKRTETQMKKSQEDFVKARDTMIELQKKFAPRK